MDEGHDSDDDEDYLFLPSTILENKLYLSCCSIAGKKNGAVLVHCMAGVSRSATIVIAYLMYKKGMKYEEAYAYVKERRKIIHPNSGFKRQLISFEKELFSSVSFQQSEQSSASPSPSPSPSSDSDSY